MSRSRIRKTPVPPELLAALPRKKDAITSDSGKWLEQDLKKDHEDPDRRDLTGRDSERKYKDGILYFSRLKEMNDEMLAEAEARFRSTGDHNYEFDIKSLRVQEGILKEVSRLYKEGKFREEGSALIQITHVVRVKRTTRSPYDWVALRRSELQQDIEAGQSTLDEEEIEQMKNEEIILRGMFEHMVHMDMFDKVKKP